MTRVVAGVIVRDGRVLVCQRRPDGDHPGKWEFPGGKVEKGETLETALRRELREELGIDATAGEILERRRHRYPRRDEIELVFLRVDRFEGEPENRAFGAIAWVARGALPGIDFLAADRAFVAKLACDSFALGPSGGQ